MNALSFTMNYQCTFESTDVVFIESITNTGLIVLINWCLLFKYKADISCQDFYYFEMFLFDCH